MSLPQGITYALVAGVDPKFGVYSAIVVTFVASIFGSSSHLVNGPTSAISLLVFSSLAFLDPENRTVLFEALFLLGVLVGTFQILIAVFKLGDLTRYISESVILGFLLAAAILIALGQLGNALGVKDQGNGRQSVLKRTYLTLFHGEALQLPRADHQRRDRRPGHRAAALGETLRAAATGPAGGADLCRPDRVSGRMVDRRSHRQHRGDADRENPAEPAAPAHPVRATRAK